MIGTARQRNRDSSVFVESTVGLHYMPIDANNWIMIHNRSDCEAAAMRHKRPGTDSGQTRCNLRFNKEVSIKPTYEYQQQIAGHLSVVIAIM
jgi:hypothetical protein